MIVTSVSGLALQVNCTSIRRERWWKGMILMAEENVEVTFSSLTGNIQPSKQRWLTFQETNFCHPFDLCDCSLKSTTLFLGMVAVIVLFFLSRSSTNVWYCSLHLASIVLRHSTDCLSIMSFNPYPPRTISENLYFLGIQNVTVNTILALLSNSFLHQNQAMFSFKWPTNIRETICMIPVIFSTKNHAKWCCWEDKG